MIEKILTPLEQSEESLLEQLKILGENKGYVVLRGKYCYLHCRALTEEEAFDEPIGIKWYVTLNEQKHIIGLHDGHDTFYEAYEEYKQIEQHQAIEEYVYSSLLNDTKIEISKLTEIEGSYYAR